MDKSWLNPRLIVWLFVVIVLTGILLTETEKVRPEAERVAFTIAARQMLEKANRYKESWLLQDRPQSATVFGDKVWFGQRGWPLPLTASGGEVDCKFWLALLYPDTKIFALYPEYQDQSTDQAYQCRYNYRYGQAVVIRLQQGQLSVSLDHRGSEH
jgi:MSHA biogenesis protein MshF